MTLFLLEKKTSTYPIVKRIGGKRQLLSEIKNNLPKTFNYLIGINIYNLNEFKKRMFDVQDV